MSFKLTNNIYPKKKNHLILLNFFFGMARRRWVFFLYLPLYKFFFFGSLISSVLIGNMGNLYFFF